MKKNLLFFGFLCSLVVFSPVANAAMFRSRSEDSQQDFDDFLPPGGLGRQRAPERDIIWGLVKAVDVLNDEKEALESVHANLDEEDVNVDERDHRGRTALQIAAEKGMVLVVKLLIHRDAEVNAQDGVGRTALYVACDKGWDGVVAEFLKYPYDVDFNLGDNSKVTPLHIAAERGHDNIVRMLLENRDITIKVDVQDSNGRTPLHYAVEAGHDGIVSMLLESGATNLADGNNVTPMHVAAERGHVNIVTLFLQKNFSPTVKDLRGKTPREVAKGAGKTSVVDLFDRWFGGGRRRKNRPRKAAVIDVEDTIW